MSGQVTECCGHHDPDVIRWNQHNGMVQCHNCGHVYVPQRVASNSLDDFDHPIHSWFELSYAQFLTVPRLVLESMPLEWQRQMAALLQEMDDTFDWRPKEGRYWVRLKDANGRFCDAPLNDYRHGSVEHLRYPTR